MHFHFTMGKILTKASSALCRAEKESHRMHNCVLAKHICTLPTQGTKTALATHAAKDMGFSILGHCLRLVWSNRPDMVILQELANA
jgi:hypothetical protein